MKVSEVIDRVKRIEVIMDTIDNKNWIDSSTTVEDIFDLLGEYKDELLNKVVK